MAKFWSIQYTGTPDKGSHTCIPSYTHNRQQPNTYLSCSFTKECILFPNIHHQRHQNRITQQNQVLYLQFLRQGIPAVFVHSIGVCRMRRSLAVLRSFSHSTLLCALPFHPFPPTILPSSLTSSSRLFLGLPLNLIVPKFIYNTLGNFISFHSLYMPKPT